MPAIIQARILHPNLNPQTEILMCHRTLPQSEPEALNRLNPFFLKALNPACEVLMCHCAAGRNCSYGRWVES